MEDKILSKILSEIVPVEQTREHVQNFIASGYECLNNLDSIGKAVEFLKSQKTKDMKAYFIDAQHGTLDLGAWGIGSLETSILNFSDSGDINKEAIIYAMNNLKSNPEKSYLGKNKEGQTHLIMEGKGLVGGGFHNENYYTAFVIGNSGKKGELFKESKSTSLYDPHMDLARLVSKEVAREFDDTTKWFEEKYSYKYRRDLI